MLLALDTSTLTLSLALLDRDGSVREQRFEGPQARISQRLPLALDELLGRHALTWADLDGFVVGLGPGSFTGLRIGLATVKGLAFALRKPVAGVSSLKAVALEGPEDTELYSVAVVKKGELYLGRYQRTQASLRMLAPETSLTVGELAAELKRNPSAVALGPALVDYRAALLEQGVAQPQLLTTGAVPSAVALAKLAALTAYDEPAMFALEPHYLRGSGAEENPKFPPLPGPAPLARLKEEEP